MINKQYKDKKYLIIHSNKNKKYLTNNNINQLI